MHPQMQTILEEYVESGHTSLKPLVRLLCLSTDGKLHPSKSKSPWVVDLLVEKQAEMTFLCGQI